jgi:hypothetical protein
VAFGTSAPVLHERVVALHAWLHLRADDHGAHLQRSLADVRHGERRLEGAHRAVFVLSHRHFYPVAARRQLERRLVLNRLPADFGRAFNLQLHGIADAADWPARFVQHEAEDVEGGAIFGGGMRERHVRSRHDHRQRHVEPRVGQPEK